MRVACVAAITNAAAGLSKEKLSHEGTLQFGEIAARKLINSGISLVNLRAAISPNCKVPSCESFSLLKPAAALVIAATHATRIPQCRAIMTSGTTDIPTASAPHCLKARISAGVSNEGPNVEI